MDESFTDASMHPCNTMDKHHDNSPAGLLQVELKSIES